MSNFVASLILSTLVGLNLYLENYGAAAAIFTLAILNAIDLAGRGKP